MKKRKNHVLKKKFRKNLTTKNSLCLYLQTFKLSFTESRFVFRLHARWTLCESSLKANLLPNAQHAREHGRCHTGNSISLAHFDITKENKQAMFFCNGTTIQRQTWSVKPTFYWRPIEARDATTKTSGSIFIKYTLLADLSFVVGSNQREWITMSGRCLIDFLFEHGITRALPEDISPIEKLVQGSN